MSPAASAGSLSPGLQGLGVEGFRVYKGLGLKV